MSFAKNFHVAILAFCALTATTISNGAATAASFDCQKASTKIEQAICANEELSSFDTELADDFHSAMAHYSGNDRSDLLANQKSWLRERDRKCASKSPVDTECITEKYRGRISDLKYLVRSPKPGLDGLLWTQGAVCSGNSALIRFADGEDALPIGGGLARAISHGDSCRLADGRVVKFKTAGLGNFTGHGPCYNGESEIYSVWIGDKKVISREIRNNKCGSNPVRAIYLNGIRLTQCQDKLDPISLKLETRNCEDISARLEKPIHESLRQNSILVTFSAPHLQPFCQSMIRDASDDEAVGDANWPRKTARPAPETLIPEDTSATDLNNSGTSQRVYFVQLQVPEDGSYWVIPPPGLSDVEADAMAHNVGPDALRKRGFQVFAGDQTPYKSISYTVITAFRKNGSTWFSARYAVNDLDLPTQVIIRPKPDGTQDLVCRYQSTPNL